MWTDEESLSRAFSFATADMTCSARVGFACSYHSYPSQHRLIFYHPCETIEGHVADNSVQSFTFSVCSLPDSREVTQDNVRVGRIGEADYSFADSVKDSVYATLLLRSDSFYNLG